MTLSRREIGALGALAVIGAITAVWWALALWPLPGDAPDWLVRTPAVCFGSPRDGLPTTAGWMALIGQPVYMLATLWLISGQSVARGLKAISRLPAGRVTLAAAFGLTVVGLSAAGIRVARAGNARDFVSAAPVPTVDDVPRLHRAAPPLALIDQQGEQITLSRFRGRPVLVAFAFAHCETMCPLIVNDVLRAQAELGEPQAAVVIVTLDPWRDPPARLPGIARQWKLTSNAHVLSGSVEDVERTLDAWEVGHTRDARTGDVTHAGVVYVLDPSGNIAFALTGVTDARLLAALARRL